MICRRRIVYIRSEIEVYWKETTPVSTDECRNESVKCSCESQLHWDVKIHHTPPRAPSERAVFNQHSLTHAWNCVRNERKKKKKSRGIKQGFPILIPLKWYLQSHGAARKLYKNGFVHSVKLFEIMIEMSGPFTKLL